jgi:hypothetical protein
MTNIQPATEQKQPSKRPYVVILALLVVVSVVYVATYQRNERFVPETLGELQLGELLSGAAAQEMIDHLHAKGVTPAENEIGFYDAPGGKATLYVSVYANEADAGTAERKMAELIRAGNPIFGEYDERSIGDQVVHRCFGMGQEHFFFSVGTRLYWLGVDEPLAEQTLSELLKVVKQ